MKGKTIYIAQISYGRPELSKAIIRKETDKMYMLEKGKTENLIGYVYFGLRVHKDSKDVFFNIVDALKHLLDLLDLYIKKTKENADAVISRASDDRSMIEKLLLEEFD